MTEEQQALLRHDMQAALLNHSGVHREIEDSLQQLSEVLRLLVPSAEDIRCAPDAREREGLAAQLKEIVVDDLDQCLPMLQLSSERLSALLTRVVDGKTERYD